ncbi:D-alanyl-D-alanine carboxypeptidase/D-alanyl-D-alanine endopeptidase [Actinokineospora sp. 24-640]
MRDGGSGDQGRAQENAPEQGEHASPPEIAWPGAEQAEWRPDDTAGTAPTPPDPPLRDETHVPDAPAEPTPPSEPRWPATDPGPTEELPTPQPDPTRVMRPVADPSAPQADTRPHAPGDRGRQSPADNRPSPGDRAQQPLRSADGPEQRPGDRTQETPRPPDGRPQSPDDRTRQVPHTADARPPSPGDRGRQAPHSADGRPQAPDDRTRQTPRPPDARPQAPFPQRPAPRQGPPGHPRPDGRPGGPRAPHGPPGPREQPGQQGRPTQQGEATRVVRPVPPERQAEETRVVRPVGTEQPADPPRTSEADSSTEDGKPRRRRTGLVIAIAAAVVVALAAGVVFVVPGVAERLGLRSAPEVAIAPPPEAVVFSPVLTAPGASAPAPSADGVAAALAGPAASPALGTLTGVVIDPLNGQTLFSRGADTPLVPASTTKILSSAAALLLLPHTEQLSTRVVAGDKPGTVVIIGGGDPSLSSLPRGKDSVYPGAAHLDDLVAQVKAKGPVNTVLVDLGRYTGDDLARGWDPADVPAGHITPIVPAMLDGARQDPTTAVSRRSGNPGRALAEAFAKRIGATVPGSASTTAAPNAKVLGEVKSAPVVELVDTVLQRSDNVLAETLIREVAIAKGAPPTFAGATDSVIGVLRDNGFAVDGLTLRDGSGLSTENKVTAALLAEVLKVAAGDGSDPRTAKLRPLLGGLPVAGGSGTLATRYLEPPAAAGKGWVRAKTGTLSAVSSLAGVVLDTDGRLLVFALMSNGSNPGDARPALDTVAAALRKCGCR